MIVDRTRLPRYRADIGIKNGRIAKIGQLNSSDGTNRRNSTHVSLDYRRTRSAHPVSILSATAMSYTHPPIH